MLDWLDPAAAWAGLQEFLERGGPILLWIMLSTFVMWAFILERTVYFALAHSRYADRAVAEWRARSDRKSRLAHWIRDQLVSEVRLRAEQNVNLIKTLVALAPLLGLMGTVTGMVEVFDVMSISGNSNARAMSSGVSKATIPTMAGMVAALSGLIFSDRIERQARRKVLKLEDALEIG